MLARSFAAVCVCSAGQPQKVIWVTVLLCVKTVEVDYICFGWLHFLTDVLLLMVCYSICVCVCACVWVCVCVCLLALGFLHACLCDCILDYNIKCTLHIFYYECAHINTCIYSYCMCVCVTERKKKKLNSENRKKWNMSAGLVRHTDCPYWRKEGC